MHQLCSDENYWDQYKYLTWAVWFRQWIQPSSDYTSSYVEIVWKNWVKQTPLILSEGRIILNFKLVRHFFNSYSLCPKSFRRKRRTDVSHKFSYFFCTDDLINSYVLGEFDLRIFRVFKFRPWKTQRDVIFFLRAIFLTAPVRYL